MSSTDVGPPVALSRRLTDAIRRLRRPPERKTAGRHGVVSATVIVYAAALALLPYLPARALTLLGAAIMVALAGRWQADGRPIRPVYPLALWLPLHLLLLASGGTASPAVPLIAAWLVFVAAWATLPLTLTAGAFAGALVAAADAWSGALSPAGLMEVVLAMVAGFVPAWLIERRRRDTAAQVGMLERILTEARSGGDATPEAEAAKRLDEIGEALERVRRGLRSRRTVLWDIDRDAERAIPWLASGGPPPRSVSLAGDPLRWVWEEGVPLQLESRPRWAPDAPLACAVPVERDAERAALLTLEFDSTDRTPESGALEDAAAYLRAFVHTKQEQARAALARHHFQRVMDVLRALPHETEPVAFARELASAAMRLAGGTGAVVASWDGTNGRVLARVGDDGGPAVGVDFGPSANELALAARAGARLTRSHRRAARRPLPLASREERWFAPPRSLVLLPLRSAAAESAGVLAVWTADRGSPLDPEAIDVVEALAPFAALQLRQLASFHQLREHAEIDPVTALYNRRAFDAVLASECSRFDRYRRPLAAMLLDLDHFKRVNDTYGHEAGDAVLRAVAETIRASIRQADVPGRWGGEEFAVLLPETRLDEAERTAERLRRAIEAIQVAWEGEPIPVRASIGVSACPECVEDPEHVLRSADEVLYASKSAGRNRVTSATPVPG